MSKVVKVQVELMVDYETENGMDYVIEQFCDAVKKMEIAGCGVEERYYSASVKSSTPKNSV